MTQHDFNIADQGFPAFRSDMNNAHLAGVSLSSGATEPSTKFAYQWWADTTANVLKQRNAGNTAWIIRGSLEVMGVLGKTAAYTVALADFGKLIDASASGAAFTVTLPAAATVGDGFVIAVKKTDSSTNAVTIDGNGAETIDGATTLVLDRQYDSIVLRCDGSNWHVVSGRAAGLVLVATASASASATVDFSSGIDATYDEYLITFSNVVPATDAQVFHARTSTDGGSTFDSSAGNYAWAVSGISEAGGNADSNSTSDTEIQLSGVSSIGGAAGESLSGELWLHAPSAARQTILGWSLHYITSAGELVTVQGAGRRSAAEDVDAIRFLFGSGNIASGEFALYGVRK